MSGDTQEEIIENRITKEERSEKKRKRSFRKSCRKLRKANFRKSKEERMEDAWAL